MGGVSFILKELPKMRGRVIHTNKSCKKFYPEELLSKKKLSKIARLILPYFIDNKQLLKN